MRVAVYGGSFNPPHVGHAMVAGWLRWTDLVDEVWLVPTHVHPFAKDLAPFALRVRMCEALAAAVGSWVRVETIERELPTPSFTVDTLAELERRTPGTRFRLVVGADNLADVDKWKDWPGIERRWEPIVVGRQGVGGAEGTIDFPGVSSTEIRQRIREGRSIGHLVPAGVRALLESSDAFRG